MVMFGTVIGAEKGKSRAAMLGQRKGVGYSWNNESCVG